MKPSGKSQDIRLLLTDANVLIDLASVEGGMGLVGDLIRLGIAEVYLPRAIYDEIEPMISEEEVLRLGITILPVTEATTRAAQAYPDAKLSMQDRTLLAIAIEREFAVWSNDVRLRTNCSKNGVPIFWEFEILCKLVVRGFVGKEQLIAVARAVESVNRYIRLKEVSKRLEAEL